MRIAALAILIAVTGCAEQGAAPGSAGSAAATAVDRITLENRSWGALQEQWSIDASGKGSYSYSDRKPGDSYFDYEVVTTRFDAGPEGFRAVAQALAPARKAAAKAPPCGVRVSDAPYGPLRWIAGPAEAKLDLDYGCMGKQWQPIYDSVRRARDMVGGWGKAGEETERRRVKS